MAEEASSLLREPAEAESACSAAAERAPSRARRRGWRWSIAPVATCLAAAWTALRRGDAAAPGRAPRLATLEAELSALGALSIAADNEYTSGAGGNWSNSGYGPKSSKPPLGHGYQFHGVSTESAAALVEPHRLTTLSVSVLEGGELSRANARYYWEVRQLSGVAGHARGGGGGGAAGAKLEGQTVQTTFGGVGRYVAALEVHVPGAALAATQPSKLVERMLMCKYVRRELRALTRDDLENFFSAFQALMTYGTAEGQARWGENYRSLDYFVNVHLNAAADRMDDHLHDGMGFLTQHMALSNAFELSLQCVDQAVSLPYWDFTFDHTLIRRRGTSVSGIFETELWSPEVFGNAEGDMHTITRGRWAYVPVGTDANASVHNAYGYLRAPWNVNKSPYLTRGHKMCGASLEEADETSFHWCVSAPSVGERRVAPVPRPGCRARARSVHTTTLEKRDEAPPDGADSAQPPLLEGEVI